VISTGTPLLTSGIVLFVSFLLVLSGQTKKRLVLKTSTCPVCRRAKKHGTCRWT